MATISQNYTLWLNESSRKEKENFSSLSFIRSSSCVSSLCQRLGKGESCYGIEAEWKEIEAKCNQVENKRAE